MRFSFTNTTLSKVTKSFFQKDEDAKALLNCPLCSMETGRFIPIQEWLKSMDRSSSSTAFRFRGTRNSIKPWISMVSDLVGKIFPTPKFVAFDSSIDFQPDRSRTSHHFPGICIRGNDVTDMTYFSEDMVSFKGLQVSPKMQVYRYTN